MADDANKQIAGKIAERLTDMYAPAIRRRILWIAEELQGIDADADRQTVVVAVGNILAELWIGCGCHPDDVCCCFEQNREQFATLVMKSRV